MSDGSNAPPAPDAQPVAAEDPGGGFSEWSPLAETFVAAERTSSGLVLSALALAGFVATVATGALSDPVGRWIVAGAGLALVSFAVLTFIWPALHYRRTRWRFTEQALEIRRGVLWHGMVHVPRSRMQHTDVGQGPLQRRFDLATLTVHTAGSTNASIAIPGLHPQTAGALRDQLVASISARGRTDGV